MIDYLTLRVIWWVLLGVLLIAFAIMDGFDLGVAALLPVLTKKDSQRRIMINTVAPTWEGNQVWFILAGGVFFAAWPFLYATAFSGFYLVMLLLLVTFIMRPVAFKYRSKLQNRYWRNSWDWIMAIAAWCACVIFGVAVGNVLQGVPFHFDANLRLFYTGSLVSLFNPFALMSGLICAAMLTAHGAVYLSCKTEDPIASRARQYAKIVIPFLAILFLFTGWWVGHEMIGYVVTSVPDHMAPSNPLHKMVAQQTGAWFANYADYPVLWLAPALAFFSFAATYFSIGRGQGKVAFLFSALGISCIVVSVGFSMFPFILPSSSMPDSSLTVWDASASQSSLMLMLVAVVIFLPLIVVYTSWVYRVMRGRVTEDSVNANKHSY